MRNLTLKLIYAIKEVKYDGGTLQERIASFMSEYTGTERSYYTIGTIKVLIQDVFMDYLKTADDPIFEISQFFDAKRFTDDDANAMLSVLLLSDVRDDDGKYVNGFRDSN